MWMPDEADNNRPAGTMERRMSAVVPSTPGSEISHWHDRLRAAEAQRRSYFQAKLSSTALFCQCYYNVLEAGIQETAKAFRLVLGIARAQEKLAQALGKTANYEAVDNSEEPKDEAALTTLELSNAHMQQRFEESSVIMESTIVSNIQKLEESVREQAKQLKVEGSTFLKLLARCEENVMNAWGTYLTAATEVLSQVENTDTSNTATSTSTSTTNNATTPASPSNTSSSTATPSEDLWLQEMNYRSSVADQTQAWGLYHTQLSDLFSKAKDAECLRRINLRELLINFVHEQQKVFVSVEGISTLALAEWVGKEMSQDEVEADVKESIRRKVRAAGGDDDDDVPQINHAGIYNELFSASSALESDHCVFSAVVEKGVRPGAADPKIALAIVTSDRFLHLLDLPTYKVQLADSPEYAFQKLFSDRKIPDLAELELSERISIRTSSLVPTSTIMLNRCTVDMSQEDNVVEITEGSRRTHLRVGSTRTQIAIIAALHGERAAATGEEGGEQ